MATGSRVWAINVASLAAVTSSAGAEIPKRGGILTYMIAADAPYDHVRTQASGAIHRITYIGLRWSPEYSSRPGTASWATAGGAEVHPPGASGAATGNGRNGA
jgi:hypothetical protein